MKPPNGKENQQSIPSALYVHVPFCMAKCRYCDFYSLGMSAATARKYIRSAGAELAAHMGELTRPAATVFFGGGTPTVLGTEMLGQLLGLVRPFIDANTEFSVEANPGTVDASIAQTLQSGGVNRVNLGVQSFIESELAMLGRIHSADEARHAVAAMRQAGLENLGLDLIYALPGQTLETWETSLHQALDLGPEHLSCYALSFEPSTPMGRDLQAGKLCEMDESLQRECYYAAIEIAAAGGLEHYEISNFARPGRQCRHNLTYWHNEPYLGIGPAAASYVGGERWTNSPDIDAYLAALDAGNLPPADRENLTGRRAMAETLMLGLRLMDGVSRPAFQTRFGHDPIEAFPRTFSRYQGQNAIEVTPANIRIAKSALFVVDTILADLIAEAE